MIDESSIGKIFAEDVPRKMADTIAELSDVRKNMHLLGKRRNRIPPRLFKNLEDEYRGRLRVLEKKLLRHRDSFGQIREEQEKLMRLLGKAVTMTKEMIGDLRLNISLGNYRGQEYGMMLMQFRSQLQSYESGILDSKSVINALDGILAADSPDTAGSGHRRKNTK